MPDYGMHSGGESTLIYLVKSDDSGIVQSDGTTAATSNAHALIALTTGILEPSFALDKITLKLAKHDDALLTFIHDYAAPQSASTASDEQLFGEAGTVWDTATSGGGLDRLLIVYAGALNGETNKRLCVAALCTLDTDSYAFTTAYKKWATRTLSFTPVKAQAAISIVNGLLPTGKYGAAPTMSIAQNDMMKQDFLSTV